MLEKLILIAMGIGAIVMMVVLFALLSSIVATFCWNHSVCYLFNLPHASFFEMFCLIILLAIFRGAVSIKKRDE
jgi:Na+/alanine symporter